MPGSTRPNPSLFTLYTLREVLKRLDLPTSGNKPELVKRLMENDLEESWMDTAVTIQNGEILHGLEVGENSEGAAANLPAIPNPTSVETENHQRRNVELLQRECDLLQRELDLAQRDNQLLRESPRPQNQEESIPRHTNITSLRHLLTDFDGTSFNYTKWKNQFELLVATYRLDEAHARLLFATKLKGRALQ